MENIDPAEYQKRLDRLAEIYRQIGHHAEQQALHRCPYKNRRDECTAKFGCRYQQRTPDQSLPLCTSDDQLDYRSAWEIDPDSVAQMRQLLQQQNAPESVSPQVSVNLKTGAGKIGLSLFDHADTLNEKLPSSCGRVGTCHECIVEVAAGMDGLSPRTQHEAFLNDDFRLACQAKVINPQADINCRTLRRIPQILTATTSTTQLPVDPCVTRHDDEVHYQGEVIDKYRGRLLGIAIDLGTTTVIVELINLESGAVLATSAIENPQRFGGSDVMNRISYDAGPFTGELHGAIIRTLNSEIEQLCEQASVKRRTIYEIVVVGNATMRELFFGNDVQPIGQRPYKSEIEQAYRQGKLASTAVVELATNLNIRVNPQGRVYGVPLIASHVGGDVAAALVAINLAEQTETVMLVDAGTNTEVVVGNRDHLLVASCPAGPAFEGGLVTHGMPGCQGAIESLKVDGDGFQYQTIGSVTPVGICGSGLIELLAELRRHGRMTPLGVFEDRVQTLDILPAHGITFSRADASHLAQAKAANYCGQVALLREFDIGPSEISCLYLAGGFANYVDVDAACEIGFLAPVPSNRIQKIGNAAAQGARELLLSRRQRLTLESLIRKAKHIELETVPDFFDLFVDGCQFQPMSF